MDIDDAVDWHMIARKWEARCHSHEAALAEIDALGNGTSKDRLTAYADLMLCGSIARKALNN
jgi:hypothetical protein